MTESASTPEGPTGTPRGPAGEAPPARGRSGLKVGLVSTYGTAHHHVRVAHELEDTGWDGFFTWDGISIGEADTWDPWVLLGAVAASTRRVRLGALVFPLARRRPWKVAREALTVDHLSRGRLVLPVGLGVLDDGGFGRVGGEARELRVRAEQVDEALEILARAWTGEPFSFDGRHHTVEGLVIAPRPVQRPRVPVWPVAGLGSRRSMRRAARWDGAVLQAIGEERPLTPTEVAGAVAMLGELREELRADGHELSETFEVVVQGELAPDGERARDHLAALAEAGATWWVEARWDPRTAGPDALLELARQGPPGA